MGEVKDKGEEIPKENISPMKETSKINSTTDADNVDSEASSEVEWEVSDDEYVEATVEEKENTPEVKEKTPEVKEKTPEEQLETAKIKEKTPEKCLNKPDPPQAIYTSQGDEKSLDIESSSSETRRDGWILLHHSVCLHQAPSSSFLQTSSSSCVSTCTSVQGERSGKNKWKNF